MDKIAFVILNKISIQPLKDGHIYANGEFGAGEKSSKIIAFSKDRSKAIMQIWIDDSLNYDIDIYNVPVSAPGRFKKSGRNIFIRGKKHNIYNKIPDRYKLSKPRLKKPKSKIKI